MGKKLTKNQRMFIGGFVLLVVMGLIVGMTIWFSSDEKVEEPLKRVEEDVADIEGDEVEVDIEVDLEEEEDKKVEKPKEDIDTEIEIEDRVPLEPVPNKPEPSEPTPNKPEPNKPTPNKPAPNITTKNETKTESIAFKTETKNDSSLNKGTQVVDREGKKGVRTLVYKVTYSNGKETNRSTISDKVTTAPVSKIVRVGTKVSPSKPSGRDSAVENAIIAAVPYAGLRYDTAGGEKVPELEGYFNQLATGKISLSTYKKKLFAMKWFEGMECEVYAVETSIFTTTETNKNKIADRVKWDLLGAGEFRRAYAYWDSNAGQYKIVAVSLGMQC